MNLQYDFNFSEKFAHLSLVTISHHTIALGRKEKIQPLKNF